MISAIKLHWLHDPVTSTLSYILWDPHTHDAVVIDPLLEAEPEQRASTHKLNKFIEVMSLRVHWILETHIHADHFSAARELRAVCPGASLAIGARAPEVFATIRKKFNWPMSDLKKMGIDRFVMDGEELRAGSLRVQVIETPGHTPACVSYRIGARVFTGDALMTAGFGTGRCDFPGGSAAALYDSIHNKLYALPGDTRVYPAHDYAQTAAELSFGETIATQSRHNKHLRLATTKSEFVAFREGRDATLTMPQLFEPSLSWNLGAF